MDRLEHLDIIQKGLTSYSSLVVLVKRKNQNLYRVCSVFQILNEKLLKINYTFPLVRDCIEQLGKKMLSLLEHHRSERCISHITISSFISKILWNYTILCFTYMPLPMNGYGYECESVNLATIHKSCISR